MSEQLENMPEQAGETLQFSIDKTRPVALSKAAKKIDIEERKETIAQEFEEEDLLKKQSIPTEFEDVFSDTDRFEADSSGIEGVVAIEEVFKQKAEMINEDFHNETGEEPVAPTNPKLKRAAIIIGIISAVIIAAAAAVAAIIIF